MVLLYVYIKIIVLIMLQCFSKQLKYKLFITGRQCFKLLKQTSQLMLWSQINLTLYDFTDLYITGEFDNRPGNGPDEKIFLLRGLRYCNMGASRRLYIKTSVNAQPGTLWCFMRSAGHRTRIFICNGEFSYIKNCYHSSKETGC